MLCFVFGNVGAILLSLAIRDYWDLAKEGAKDDKYVVLVSSKHPCKKICAG